MANEWKEAQNQSPLSDEEFLEALWESEMGGWKRLQETLRETPTREAQEAPKPAHTVRTSAVAANDSQVNDEALLPDVLLNDVLLNDVLLNDVLKDIFVDTVVIDPVDDHDELPAPPLKAPPVRYPSFEEMVARMESEIPTSVNPGVGLPFAAAHAPLKKEIEQHLVFSLAGTRYAIPTKNVMEVGRMPLITAVPNLPSWMLGVTNRRGDIISVIDFRGFLNLEASGDSLESKRILFVKTRDEEVETALVVDQINRIANLETLKILAEDAPPEMKLAPFLRGICEHNETSLTVLDLERLLQSHEVRQFESQASVN